MLFVQFGWVLFSVIMSFGAYKLCLHRPSIALFLHMQKEYTQLEFTWYTHPMYAFMYGEYVNCKRSVLVLFAFCYNYLCRRWKTILTHTHTSTCKIQSIGEPQQQQHHLAINRRSNIQNQFRYCFLATLGCGDGDGDEAGNWGGDHGDETSNDDGGEAGRGTFIKTHKS